MRLPIHAKLLGALGFLALSACATPTPYAPQQPGSYTGYTDQRLDQKRYRVTFTGNSVTRRETVEDYLLLRSAEVTLQSGFRYFVFDTRDTEAKTSYRSDFVGWPGWRGYGWYRHSWAFGSPFGPPFGPPYDSSVDSYPITRYQAYAEIVMLTPDQAKDEPRALNAQDVVNHIGAKAAPPPPPSAPPSM
jgi:hypothetical protein